MIFKCMIPGCSHFMPTKEQVIGQQSQCWGGTIERDCTNLITMNASHTLPKMTGRKPYCPDCLELRKTQKEVRARWMHLQQSQAS